MPFFYNSFIKFNKKVKKQYSTTTKIKIKKNKLTEIKHKIYDVVGKIYE